MAFMFALGVRRKRRHNRLKWGYAFPRDHGVSFFEKCAKIPLDFRVHVANTGTNSLFCECKRHNKLAGSKKLADFREKAYVPPKKGFPQMALFF